MQTHLTKPPKRPPILSQQGLNEVSLEGTQVLMSLGLTGRQARVYFALLKTGDAKAQTIAGLALVHRQEVYRLLESLQQQGLVLQNATSPTTFSATPLSDGLNLLLQHKTSQLTLITKKANRLTKKFRQTPCFNAAIEDCKPCFGVIAENDRGKRCLKTLKETQQVVEAVTSWMQFKQICFRFEPQIINLLEREISVYVVTEKPPNNPLPKWIDLALTNYANFKIHIQPTPPAATIGIFDHNQAVIAFNSDTSPTKGPHLWSTNPTLIALCHTYFKANWSNEITCIAETE
jgi:sugar-specific transcriptional regulator TrmB